MLLKNCRFVITQNRKREVLEHVDILLEGTKIVKIGKNLKAEKIIDCSNRIVMPGLINCHTHLGMSAMRGLNDDEQLENWLKDILAAEEKLTKEKAIEGAKLGILEALRTGTTTICDHYWERASSLTAAKELGIRLYYFPDFFTAHNKLDANIEKLMPSEGLPSTVVVGIAPHSIYGTDEKFLRRAREYATQHKILMHMHVAETRHERVECKQRYGMLPVEFLHHIGFLKPDVMLVHMTWLTKGELDLVAKSGASVVHCPQSNMKLASGGSMPLREMQERGVNVALGTDSTASNNSLDMFREMHVAALLHKQQYWDATAADAQTVLDMATINGAKAIHRNDLGSIEPGKTADIITLDATDVNLQPLLKERIVSHIVYAANGLNVSEVVVDGKLLLDEKRLLV